MASETNVTNGLQSVEDNSSQPDVDMNATENTNPDDEFLNYLSTTDKMKKSVRSLLRVSDFYSDLMAHHPNPRPYEFIDVICGWEATVSCPTYVMTASSNNAAKKRRSKTTIDDRRGSKVDDCPFSEFARREMVESDTYRYIPNNGSYRLMKDKRKLGQGQNKVETNYTFMPKRPSLSTEHRQIQRMINNEMKATMLDRKTDEIRDYDEDEPTCAPRVHRGLDSLKIETEPRSSEKEVKVGYSPSVVRTGTKDFRHRRREKTVVPSTDDKSVDAGVLSKAFTDRIMRNFSSKISALEDQIRGEANWWAMAAGGATYLNEKRGEKRSNSLPVESIQVLPMNRPAVPLRPLQKLPPSALQPKVYSCQTGPQSTPRYNYLDSYILNPLNLEAARPKRTSRSKEHNDAMKITGVDTPRRTKKFREERVDFDDDGNPAQAFQSSPIGKPNPRDKKLELVNEPDVLSPSVTLPELFGKKLEVAVATQKFL